MNIVNKKTKKSFKKILTFISLYAVLYILNKSESGRKRGEKLKYRASEFLS
jgi:hypothetical protein